MDTHCMICHEPGENLIKLPCCENRCHTLCGIHFIANNAHLYAKVVCPCGNDLYLSPHVYTPPPTTISIEGAEEAIKAIQAKQKQLKKAIPVYNRVLRVKQHTFNTEIYPHKMAISNAKKTMIHEICQMPEYKQTRSLAAGLRTMYRRFINKYRSSHNYGVLDDIRLRSRMLYYTPASAYKRIFRIRF